MLQCSNASMDGIHYDSSDKIVQSRYVAALQHDTQDVSRRSSARSAAPDASLRGRVPEDTASWPGLGSVERVA
jgi:hypothetical protein